MSILFKIIFRRNSVITEFFMYFIKKSTKRFLEYYRNINFLIVFIFSFSSNEIF
nr:MAG TPA_asm: hypothetical protein [Caudoviricetes sp.]